MLLRDKRQISKSPSNVFLVSITVINVFLITTKILIQEDAIEIVLKDI